VSTFALAAKHEDTRELFTPKYAELADLISRIDVGLGRIDLPGEATSINVGDFLGVPQQAGYLASVATNTLRLGHHGPRVQDLFGVQTTISAKSNRPNQKEKSESSGYRAYDNPGAFPRAWLVHEALAVENIHQINYYVDDNAFDMRSRAFVWGPQPVLEPCAIPGSVKLLKWNASSVTMFADAACRSMVVLSDTFYPGWQAWVDGERTEVFEAYACLRGVVVEAGSHLIEFRFRPRSVQIGAVMTAIGILGTGAIVIAGTRRKRQLDSPDQVNYS
jgi:hypothetical protein